MLFRENFLQRFTLDQLAPSFPSSEPKETSLPEGIHLFLTWRQVLILSNGQPENKILCMPVPKTKTALFLNLHRKVYQNYTNPLYTVVINSFLSIFYIIPLPSSHLFHLAQRNDRTTTSSMPHLFSTD